MKVQTGYLYHIKDDFFNVVCDEKPMSNHEKDKIRPTYFTIKDENILWFIPLSSKVEKYQKIINKKVQKYGFCNTILYKKNIRKRLRYFISKCFSDTRKIY